MRPSFLTQDNESSLIAHLDILPYQESTPLSPIHEDDGSMKVITSSSGSYSPDRELFAVISPANEVGTSDQHRQHRTPRQERNPDEVSQDKLSANAPGDETSRQTNQSRARNTQRADQHRLLAARLSIMNLDRAFEAVQTREYNMPLATVASIDLITRTMPQDKYSDLLSRLAAHAY